jgi:hypothetical protein
MRGLDEPDLASALANQARYPAFGTWFNSADAAEGPRAFAARAGMAGAVGFLCPSRNGLHGRCP